MRIGIANDVIISAEILRRVILRAGAHDVVWIAHDGADAVARCENDKPDLILMDLFMPKLDGVEATKKIMAQSPCAIIIATSKVEEHTGKVFEAMGAGALDAVSIPVSKDVDTLGDARELLGKIETINRLVGRPRRAEGRGLGAIQSPTASEVPSPARPRGHRVFSRWACGVDDPLGFVAVKFSGSGRHHPACGQTIRARFECVVHLDCKAADSCGA